MLNRRLFIAGTAAGVSALALPALAARPSFTLEESNTVKGVFLTEPPPAPFALEVASVVAMNLRWYLKDRYCRTWYTPNAVIPDYSVEIDLDRSEFGKTPDEFIDRCTRIAHQFNRRLEDKKPFLLFLHAAKFEFGNVFEDVAVQTKQVGDVISVGITFCASDNHYRPMPFRR